MASYYRFYQDFPRDADYDLERIRSHFGAEGIYMFEAFPVKGTFKEYIAIAERELSQNGLKNLESEDFYRLSEPETG
ncbi:MAG: hypothetical protein HYX24_00615 [Candidatus Aenigmarchaeota archaeon]|nr:hypothetical protein [Candidatus Aenigmarchaeota archaeon]